MVKVFVERENKLIKINARTAKQIMEILKVNPETVLIVKNNELILADDLLKDDDELKLLSIISSG
ncbi:MAG: hypothetical protein AABX45_01905 [Nanoarchaeota archaeon]